LKLKNAFMLFLFAVIVFPLHAQDLPKQKILFVGYAGERQGDIYVVDEDGKNLHNLTNSNFDDMSASWSPDGQHILFLSNRDYKGEDWFHGYAMYVMDENGKNVRQLVDHITYGVMPFWSPNGEFISFMQNEDKLKGYNDRDCKINIVKPDGTEREAVFGLSYCDDFGVSKGAQWSPDGEDLLMSTSGSLMVINVARKDARTEMVGKPFRYNPRWSGDGKKITYLQAPDDNNYDVFIVNADGSDEKQLTFKPTLDLGPQFAFSDSTIVFGSGSPHSLDLYALSLKDETVQQLTNTSGDKYAWKVSPNSSQIIYVMCSTNGKCGIRILDLKTLVDDSFMDETFYGVGGFSWQPLNGLS